MKLLKLTSAILISLPMTTVMADKIVCKQISGNISQLIPDSSCQIASLKADFFPDLTFLASPPSQQATSPTCFTSELSNVKLGNPAVPGSLISLTGTALSGLTLNDVGASALTAATVITFKDANGYKIGKVFTQDVVVFGPTGAVKEQLAMVDGTRMFKNGKGNLTISGDALGGATTFIGKLCADES